MTVIYPGCYDMNWPDLKRITKSISILISVKIFN